MKLVFVDIETTGLDFDRYVAIDVALVVVDYFESRSQGILKDVYSCCITCDAKDWDLADKSALKVNGYTRENHVNSKQNYIVGKEIEEFLVKHNIVQGKAFFICQNPSFDRPFFLQLMCHDEMVSLNLPYHWLDLASMYFFHHLSCTVPQMVDVSKNAIAKSLNTSIERNPHKALNGALHLMICFEKLCKLTDD